MSLSKDTICVGINKSISVDVIFDYPEVVEKIAISRKNSNGITTLYENVQASEISGTTYSFKYSVTSEDRDDFNFIFLAINTQGRAVAIKTLLILIKPTLYASGLRMISKVTGKLLSPDHKPSLTSPNNTLKYDVGGTDLGIMWEMEPTRIGLFFGDTTGKDWIPTEEGGPGRASNWRSNVLAFSTDTDLDDGLTIDSWITDENGNAREIAYSAHNTSGTGDFTSIPTAAIRVGNVDYMHYMNVRTWQSTKGWDTNWSSMYISTDNGQTWERKEEIFFGELSHFAQVCYAKNGDGYVYMIGTQSGRYDNAYLARIQQDEMLRQDEYEYWNDDSGWLKNQEFMASPIFEAPVSEISLMYHEKFKMWLVTYLNQNNGIVFRYTKDLTGEWSDDINIVSGYEYGGMYSPYMHPLKSDGDRLYFLMSMWGYYNVYLMSVDMKLYE